MRKLVLLGLMVALATSLQAVQIIDSTLNNGGFDSAPAGTYSGWDTAVPGDKFYRAAGDTSKTAYMNGWTVKRAYYLGNNNTIGFNDNITLSSGSGEMVAFANAGDMDLTSDKITVAGLNAGQTISLSFNYASRLADNTSTTTAILIFDEGLATEFTKTFTAGVATTNTSITFSDTYVLTDNYTTVTAKFQMYSHGNTVGGTNQGSVLDDVNLSVTPEPATMALLGLGGLFMRRKK